MAETLKNKGALIVNAYVTHGICSGIDFFDRFDKSCLDRFYISDSLPSKNLERELNSRITRIKIDDLVIDYIQQTHEKYKYF